ncbi:MAG: class I SAM-dependent methyltransferase [Dehalococcoidales bacterium]|nr:class I SAM-dependent methyltransferase [Dehalococcoidales bacterium]
MTDTDWIELWNTVSANTRHTGEQEKVKRGKKHFRRGVLPRPDPLLDFVLGHLKKDETVCEIGAGNGRWTLPAARLVQAVTAVEPSKSMLEMLHENITAEKLTNISVIPSRWEDADVPPHDIIICAHAMYETTDFAGFVRKIEACAKTGVYLSLRLPPHDGITGELFRKLYGHPYDSPNALIAWNALYSMGIYPNILIEKEVHHWEDATLGQAIARAKRHLNAESTSEHDILIRQTLEKRLEQKNSSYVWPDGMRSALLWWEKDSG